GEVQRRAGRQALGHELRRIRRGRRQEHVGGSALLDLGLKGRRRVGRDRDRQGRVGRQERGLGRRERRLERRCAVDRDGPAERRRRDVWRRRRRATGGGRRAATRAGGQDQNEDGERGDWCSHRSISGRQV